MSTSIFQEYWTPFALSLSAGLSTCLGASVAFCARKDANNEAKLNRRHMAFALALAGSVMITVSLWSLIPESFTDNTPEARFLSFYSLLFWKRFASFLAGCALYLVLSKFAFPEPEVVLGLDQIASDLNQDKIINPIILASANDTILSEQQSVVSPRKDHNLRVRGSLKFDSESVNFLEKSTNFKDSHRNSSHDCSEIRVESSDLPTWSRYTSGKDLTSNEARRAWRAAMLLFVSLAVHNFPEGFAVAASTMHSHKLGVTTAVAIALHNIPEGIAIAVPCLAARPDSPCLAFWLASISGLFEPLGATVAIFFLRTADKHLDDSAMFMKYVLAFVAGIMVTVAANELLPEAARHAKEEYFPLLSGLISGVVIMIISDSILES